MDYIEQQFNKIFETKGETFNLKIQAEGAHTNWLSITEHEAEYIHRLLKSNNYDERPSAQ